MIAIITVIITVVIVVYLLGYSRRVLLLLQKWTHYFETCKQDCIPINAHSKSSVNKLLELVEFKLKEVICREPTLLVMVVGVPNVGKSALINSIHQIAKSRFPGNSFVNSWNHWFEWFGWVFFLFVVELEWCCLIAQEKMKRAAVGPLPGVTQDIAGFKVWLKTLTWT